MTMRTGASLLCLFAFASAAQDLAPEVRLLARIKDRMEKELTQVPNYTCLETVTRFHKEAAPKARLLPLDTVKLEIVYSGRHEWYGSPGEENLSEQDPAAFVGGGMIGDGLFAITLHNLFIADGALFVAKGEELLDGRQTVKYDFRLPRSINRLTVNLTGGAGTVGEEGTVWFDRQSLDLLRMDGRATEIPAFLPLAEMNFVVAYARTHIGELDTLIAQQADLQMSHTSGTQDFDRIAFTHCRVFHATSAIHFETGPFDPGNAPADTRSVPAPKAPATKIPSLLAVTVELTTPISDGDAVGRLVEGRVVSNVKSKGKIVIANGATVRGRIRRLEKYRAGAHFAVGIEFTDVEVDGAPVRFYADLLSIEKRKGVQIALHEVANVRLGPTAVEVTLPELPGVASFFVDGQSFTLPAGFRTTWRTRGILNGVR